MRQIILIALLILSLGYAIYTYWPILSPLLPKFEKAKPSTTVSAPGPEATQIQTPLSSEAKLSLPTTTTISTKPAEVKLVDPFSLRISVKRKVLESKVPEEKKEVVKPKEPVLEGIWIDSNMRVAFISGQALVVGGNIMGWRVTSIQKDRVILQKGSSTKILKLEGKL